MARPNKARPIIVLFEDDPDIRAKRKTQIEKALPSSVKVVPIQDMELGGNRDRALEDRLAEKLLSSPDFQKGSIGLIVCDKALDCYADLRVASETIVTAAAKILGIPICLYERGGRKSKLGLEQRKRWEKGGIIVDEDSGRFGQECAALYDGFQKIGRAFSVMNDTEFRKKTPAEILADILGKSAETDRIALYGAGEQSMLSELVPFVKHGDTKELKRRHYPRVMGNWLYSSVLRFPGILVDMMAAGSYLNINPDDLRRNPAVKKLFESAEYHGPFAQDDTNWRWWWRRDLDTILTKAGVVSGIELAKKKGIRKVSECPCFEREDHPAGFVCMISERPVCEKHSRGGISWFPGGADLARISNSEYKKIGPFLGLY